VGSDPDGLPRRPRASFGSAAAASAPPGPRRRRERLDAPVLDLLRFGLRDHLPRLFRPPRLRQRRARNGPHRAAGPHDARLRSAPALAPAVPAEEGLEDAELPTWARFTVTKIAWIPSRPEADVYIAAALATGCEVRRMHVVKAGGRWWFSDVEWWDDANAWSRTVATIWAAMPHQQISDALTTALDDVSARPARALERLDAVVDVEPLPPKVRARIRLLRAKALEAKGKQDLALKETGEALALWPNHPGALLLKARIEREQGRFEASLATSASHNGVAGRNPFSCFTEGWCLASLGRISEAIAAFRRGMEMEQPGVDNAFQLGIQLAETKPADAAALFIQVIDHGGDAVAARFKTMMEAMNAARAPEAVRDVEKPWLLEFFRCVAHAGAGHAAKAKAVAERAEKSNPGSCFVRFMKAAMARFEKRDADAARELVAVLNEAPTYAGAVEEMTWLREVLKRPEVAKAITAAKAKTTKE
jgi:tetratricopeptide (TPR) repeat protein